MMRSQHLEGFSSLVPPLPRTSSDPLSSQAEGTDNASEYIFPKRKKRRRGNKITAQPMATGDAVQAASPVMSMSMNSVLHLFSSNRADKASDSLTLASYSIPQQFKPSIPSDSCVTPIQPNQCSRWDQLEESLQDLDASGYQQVPEEAHRHLFSLLDAILSTRRSYRRLLQYRGQQAQLLVNALQWLSFQGHKKRKFMQALLRLSKRAKLLPHSFSLPGVEIGEVFIETPSVDIFRGLHRGREQSQPNGIREALVDLLIRETIIWYNHRHPNVLPFEGVFRPDDDFGKVYLVSPFLANGTVVEYLKRYPNVRRQLLLLDVLSGLSYLHTNKIVHGDIKGANVLVDARGRACLADLGLSRLTDTQILTWTSIQSTMPPWGTLPWQAPELLSAQLQYSERFPSPTTFSDVYAFGCLAYEIFTGLLPFAELSTRGWSYIQVHRMISTQVVTRGRRPQKPAENDPAYLCYGLTDSIWDMMERCWDHEPRRRASADDLSRLPFLVDVLDDRPVPE